MNAALLAAYAELDALRLAYADDESRVDESEIHAARRMVWKLENRIARQTPRRRRVLTRIQRREELLAYCLARRPHLTWV